MRRATVRNLNSTVLKRTCGMSSLRVNRRPQRHFTHRSPLFQNSTRHSIVADAKSIRSFWNDVTRAVSAKYYKFFEEFRRIVTFLHGQAQTTRWSKSKNVKAASMTKAYARPLGVASSFVFALRHEEFDFLNSLKTSSNATVADFTLCGIVAARSMRRLLRIVLPFLKGG